MAILSAPSAAVIKEDAVATFTALVAVRVVLAWSMIAFTMAEMAIVISAYPILAPDLFVLSISNCPPPHLH